MFYSFVMRSTFPLLSSKSVSSILSKFYLFINYVTVSEKRGDPAQNV